MNQTITCEVCDNSYDLGLEIKWVKRDETGTPQWYRCSHHLDEDDFDDKEYVKGWELLNDQ